MDTISYLRFIASLVLVVGILFAVLWALRKFGFGGMVPRTAGRRRRLGVVEAVAVDARRRLILVRRDGHEHLLLVGGSTDLVIEAGIKADDAVPPDPTPADSDEERRP